MLCAIGVLVGTACDERMKSSETRSVGTNSAERAVAPTSPEVRAAGEQALVDNTRKNVRDRDDTVTPMDQGNSTAETAITASIRKVVMAEPSLSFTARNVKVITMGTRVTLRGPVATEAEKTLIGAVAMGTTGVSGIDNQLEVQP